MKYIFLLLALTQEFFCKPHTYEAYMSPMKPITRNHVHRQRREDTKTNYITSEHEKDYKKSFSDARLLMIGPDSVEFINEFNINEKDSQECDTHYLKIMFRKIIRLENGTNNNIPFFGFINMIATGPSADEVHLEPSVQENFDCILIKR